MVESKVIPGDPFDYRDSLQLAIKNVESGRLAALDTNNKEWQRAALDLAIALGDCLIRDIPTQSNTVYYLPAPLAIAALRGLSSAVQQEIVFLEGEDDCEGEEESDLDLLETRVNFWAAEVAIHESTPPIKADVLVFTREWETSRKQSQVDLARFDALLEQRIDGIAAYLLTTPAWDPLRGISSKFLQHLPPILGVRLEEAKREILEMSRTVPTGSTWAAVRRRIEQRQGSALQGHSVMRLPLPALPASEDTHSEGITPKVRLTWESPDRKYFAVLEVPSSPNRGDETRLFPLRFLKSNGEPALEMQGLTAELAGHNLPIDAPGETRISLRDLRGVKELVLRVQAGSQSGSELWCPQQN